MKALRRAAQAAVVAAIVLGMLFAAYAWLRSRPQDLPWTPLDLAQPIGIATGGKLTALTRDFAQCRALLDQAGVRFQPLAAVTEGACGYADGVELQPGGARRIAFRPARLGMACPVAASLALWEWQVVQPAAERHFGSKVTEFLHLGSYNCRRMYSRETGPLSEHATADAVDIAGFVLADGRRITLLADWDDAGPAGAFLRDVRDGACDLFATTLSPEYNAAHRDHFHLDHADRGAMRWRVCR
ncbi:extensin [Sphingomonas sp. SFZ2018-12]|uniref:extensin-like domain-containing protein n=1 Tax=Sphingomonas sp. SFZ2018-12 TaxID=2683197 RepID=UPI001F0F4398|nr:extensin family protein [Sphingomonas sp. SFZ2018-12]MCH4893155.1 extensin [Sphingomonas sp. SFZ2018-12]